MSDKPAEKPIQKIDISSVEESSNSAIDEFRLHVLNEIHAQIMILIFLASAFTIVVYFNVTVITIFESTRWFALIGAVGFIGLFLLKRRLRLSLLDGLLYNLFGIGPMGLALFLFINAQCSDTYTEIYKVEKREHGGSGYTLTLENDVLDDYWHIRNLDRDESTIRVGRIQYTFCEGLFGYKVMEDRQMVR